MNKTAIILTVLLTACAGQPGPQATLWYPEDGESLLLDAKQRLVINTVTDDGRVICAEPAPDVVSSINSDFGIKAAAGQGPVKAGSADIGRDVQESVTNLGTRSQNVQLLRDGLYRACEAYANGLLEREDYQKILVSYDKILIALVAIEALGNQPGSEESVIAIEELVKTYFCLHNDLEICTPE